MIVFYLGFLVYIVLVLVEIKIIIMMIHNNKLMIKLFNNKLKFYNLVLKYICKIKYKIIYNSSNNNNKNEKK